MRADLAPASTTAAAVRRVRRMVGRDPHEPSRAATPLELLFDLAFVAAFGIAGSQMAHALAEGDVAVALGGFGFGAFAITWAWITVSWFASAFDTDDWLYRLTTMVQMVGVIVLALGLSDIVRSLEEGRGIDAGVVVAGYVVMRVALLAQWLRLAVQAPTHRRAALTSAATIAIAQLGWIVMAVLHLPLVPAIAVTLGLILVELVGPVAAERRHPTPWHPHHIAERYGLLAIIALGEGVLGTVAAVQPVIDRQGWSGDAIVLMTAGVVLTFGMWWAYFSVPFGALLHRARGGSFAFGYLHIVVFAAIAAVGAGLHVGAYVIEGEARIGFGEATRAVAIPVGVFLVTFLAIGGVLSRRVHWAHLATLALAVGMLALAVVLSSTGTPFALDILLVAAAPWIVVVGAETVGRRDVATSIAR